jgi:chromosome segregation protein
MKLSKIVIYGFKSFADRTVISFPMHFNGIVGPNGSGKSNIIDAIRWVLGEQSSKVLRSSKIEEIIFSGSKYRPPVNYAKVDVHFLIKTNSSAQKELVISKEATRKNEVKYYINNQRVQLKEINKITLKYNFSKDSLNIIGQGTISQIINSDLASKQKIIDIATGVMKYKINYRDAINKINRTDQDLEKLRLIELEQKKAIIKLEKQKEKAEEFKKEERIYRAKKVEYIQYSFALLRLIEKKQSEEVKHIGIKNQQVREKQEKNQGKIVFNRNHISELEFKLESANQELINNDRKYNQVKSRLDMLEYEKDSLIRIQTVNKERTRQIKERKEQNKLKINEFQSKIKFITENIINDERELVNNTQFLNNIQEDTHKIKQSHHDILSKQIHIRNEIKILDDKIENKNHLPFSIKKVLENTTLKNDGILADLIDFEAKYENAISVWAGKSLLNIIVESKKDAKDVIKYVTNNNYGRVTVYPLDSYHDFQSKKMILPSDAINYLSYYIKTDQKYDNLVNYIFGNVILVENYDKGVKVFEELCQKNNVITLDGTIFAANKSISGGKSQRKSDIFIEKQLAKAKKDSLILKQELMQVQTTLSNKENDEIKYRKQIDTLNNSVISQKSQLEYLYRSVTMLEDETAQNTNYNDNEDSKIVNISKTIANISDEVITFEKENEKNLNFIRDIQKKISQLKNENDLLEKIKNNLTQEHMDIVLELQKSQIEHEGTKSRISSIKEKHARELSVKHQINQSRVTKKDIELINNELIYLENRINQFGYVNVQAIEEYESNKIKFRELEKNIEEIETAKNNLSEDIEKLMRKIKLTFNENFKKINDEFSKCFKELFGAGEAKLIKVDSDNSAGIDIIVSPPGKKMQNMNLLSGGEKTLTTFALLVAIIRSMKQDFIILDEVEAMLDESNVDKVGKMLTKLSQTQVIMITHRTTSMSYMDLIYGVTMEEGGISKVLKLKLKKDKNEE